MLPLKLSYSEIASGMVFTSDFYNISVDSTAMSLHNNTAITMYTENCNYANIKL